MSALTLVALAVVAVLTSTVSGVLGMAGGIALLGLMTALLPAPLVVPLHGVVQLASNGSRALVFVRRVSWPLFLAYAPGLVVGITLATLLLRRVEVPYFSAVIGALLLAFLVWRRFSPTLRALPLAVYPVLGLVVGLLTLVVGATGPLIAPFFFRDDLAKEDIIATKAICQMVGHALKIPAFLALGFAYHEHLGALAVLVVASVAGTLLGKRALERMDRALFDRVFQLVLGAVALYLIARGVVVG